MAKINFPKNENNFDAWFRQFQEAFGQNAKEFGFTASDVKTLNQLYKAWKGWLNTWNQFSQLNKGMTQFHNSQFATFQNVLAGYWNDVVTNPEFDGDATKWFGNGAPKRVAMPKRSKARKSTTTTSSTKSTSTTSTKSTKSARGRRTIAKPSPLTTSLSTFTNGATSKNGTVSSTVPFLGVTSSKSNQVNVYVGSTKNSSFALPAGATGAMIQFRFGRQSWRKVTEGADFPFVHNTPNTGGKTVYYRACWLYGKKKGPWSASTPFINETTRVA